VSSSFVVVVVVSQRAPVALHRSRERERKRESVCVYLSQRDRERELGRGNATCWREVEEGEDTEKSVAEDGGKNNKGTSVGMAGSSQQHQQQPWPSPRHFRSLLSITRPTVSLLPVNALYPISSSSSSSCEYCSCLTFSGSEV
jgi:hypothetical protein